MEDSGLINPNLVTFLGTILNIGVLFFLLRLILFKPVTKFMEARAKKIEDTITQTERDKSQTQRLLAQYEARLKTAEAEAEEIIRIARETAASEAARIVAEGKHEAEVMQAKARRQMDAEHETALAQFRTEAVMLVMAVSSRLIGRELQNDDNSRYANMLMNELSSHYAGAPPAVRKGNI
jgi:F-type H+-transporting ATPase subunit b